MKKNRNAYYNVVQQNYGQGWEDVYASRCNSLGVDLTPNESKQIKRDYEKNTNYPTRVVFRREKK